MIKLKGKHAFEQCGKSYDWIARKPETGEVFVDRSMNHHIKSFDIINGNFSF